MSPEQLVALLALIADLSAQMRSQQQEIERLRAQVEDEPPSGRT